MLKDFEDSRVAVKQFVQVYNIYLRPATIASVFQDPLHASCGSLL